MTITAQITAGEAYLYAILAVIACVALVALVIFAWAIGLHVRDLHARRVYRRDRDARRKLERDIRASRPIGGVSRRYSN